MTFAEEISLAGIAVTLLIAAMPAVGTWWTMKYRMDRIEREVEALDADHFHRIYDKLEELTKSVSRIEGRIGNGQR